MLKQLNVRNFALIQEAVLNFDDEYTVITGETGSGKSILLNALHLLLGERADYKVIGNNGEKAVVEATFQINEGEFSHFFSQNDIDSEQETIVRREITRQGKSRAFINDIPVQLNILKEFTEQLVSIHSQYNTLDLKRKDFQLQTLDLLADTRPLQVEFSTLYERSKIVYRAIQAEQEQLDQLEKDRDYNDFQLKELEELGLEKNNFSNLEEQLVRFENAAEIQQLTGGIISGLGNEGALIDQLQSLKSLASKLGRIDKDNQAVEQRIQSVIIELKDIETELSETAGKSEESNEQHQQLLTELLDKYNRVLLKHKCTDEHELKELYSQLQQTASNTDDVRNTIAQLEQEFTSLKAQLDTIAGKLHEQRIKAVGPIEEKIQDSLAELKLPDTRLSFKLEQQEKFNSYGNSSLSLLFSANKGIAPVEIEKAASGGELSRVMLALQQLISEKTQLPTIFFDEIDTGVSGDVAQKIGNLLKQMGTTMQLFAISHLPQVAAKAKHHFKVEKAAIGDTVQTVIRPLSYEQRIEEIARLMSGETINEAAISNAKALMI